MNTIIEENHISENITIKDNQGLDYELEVLHSFDENQQLLSVIINLIRNNRNTNVGNANLVFMSRTDALIGDIFIEEKVKFANWNDKFYRVLHPLEPTNYRHRGLGTKLLKYIIDLAKNKGIKTLHCSLTEKDITNNPNLINWYKKHKFKIENPTSQEVSSAKYRTCLYLN